MKRIAWYLRVSTDDQDTHNQAQALADAARRHGWPIASVFVDHAVSGSKGREKRPAFDALCQAVARREVDLVCAWSVDRLGRSLQDLVTFLGTLKAKGVDLYLHQQGLDTSTPAGEAMFGMLGIFAQFERAIIIERIKAGLTRARAQGKVGGRPKLDDAIVAAVRADLDAGKSYRAIASEHGIGQGVITRIKRAA